MMTPAETGLVEFLPAARALRPEELVEEVLQQRIVRERPGHYRRPPRPRHLNRADVDDRRSHALGHTDEGRLQRVDRALRRARRRRALRQTREEQRMNPEACAKKGEKDGNGKSDTDTSRQHGNRLALRIAALAG